MNILGLSFNNHDASATLIINGKIIASASEERFSRQKHDPSYPKEAINFCLIQAGIQKEDIDYVAYHENPIIKLSRSLSTTLSQWPYSFMAFYNHMKTFITKELWIKFTISKDLSISPKKIIYVSHHLAHAAHAFYTSPFENSAILTVDAVGEWSTTEIHLGDLSKKKSIEILEATPFPHSLGLVYSAFTTFLGFRANSEECSTMALAAFGQPVYLNEIKKIIHLIPEGTFKIDQTYFNFSNQTDLPITNKFIKAFGSPRSPYSKLSFSIFNSFSPTHDEQRFADIACSIQSYLEKSLIHLSNYSKILTKSENLCLAGGIALNCVANRVIIDSDIFKNIYIPPDPGDGGGAMGAALYIANQKNKVEKKSLSVYLGQDHTVDDIQSTITSFNQLRDHKIDSHLFSSDIEMIKAAAKSINSNKIIGWLQGRFENGPRALGSRSILILPDNINNALKLSSKIKHRQLFRPYSCSMTEDAAKQYLENYKFDSLASKWMLATVKVNTKGKDILKAALHVDQTTRVQIVKRGDNPLFYILLKELGKLNGVEAVLNTSLNERGEPMINSPYEALVLFLRTSIDNLYINRLVIQNGHCNV